jgi:hypothetical protein
MTRLEVSPHVQIDHFISELIEVNIAATNVSLKEIFLAFMVWVDGLVDFFTVMVKLFDHSHDIDDF